MHHALASEESVQAVHGHGQLVHAWTANTIPMMVSVFTAGADAIVTNFPQVMRSVVERSHAKCHSVLGLERTLESAAEQPLAARDEL